MAELFKEVKDLALSCGFSHVGDLDVSTIQLREEVRAACAENKCKAYGVRWSCPPGCGTLKQCEERIRKYRRGVILQTTGELEDVMDGEGMMDTAKLHSDYIDAFSQAVRKLYPNCMMINAGACRRCESCTYPTEPCRFPDQLSSSMEAYGMIVSDVCQANNLPYYYGLKTITYTGCVLLE